MMTLRQWKNRLIKETTTQEVTIDFFKVQVFDDVPEVLRLTQEDEGKRIWLADEYRTKSIKLKKLHDTHYDILYIGEKKYRTVYPQEAILHPDELTEERLEEYGHEIKDGRKL